MSISQLVLLSQKHVQCSQQVSENTLSEKMVDRTGKLVEKAAQIHRLGPCLMNRDR